MTDKAGWAINQTGTKPCQKRQDQATVVQHRAVFRQARHPMLKISPMPEELPLTPFEVRAMWQAGKQPDDSSSPPEMVKQ